MRSTFRAIFAAVCLACGATAQAQYSTVTSPFNNVSNSFFEQFSVGFGFRGDGFFFNQNGAGAALPPFGNFDPNAGATFGFGGPNAFLNISASQGSSSSMTSQSPSITVPNGIPGSFFQGSVRPFVIAVIPVVGDEGEVDSSPLRERLSRLSQEAQSTKPKAPSPSGGARARKDSHASAADEISRKLAQARASTAGQPAASVAEIRRRREAKQQADESEAQRLLAEAARAESQGKPAVARQYRLQAARLKPAGGPLQSGASNE